MLHSDQLAQRIAQRTRIGSKQFTPINLADASALRHAQESDAVALAQSSLASFFEATHGVSLDRQTWATVKYYYAAFYACRALMLLRGVSIFYIGRSPHSLTSQAGQSVNREGGNSHSLTLEKFSQKFRADPILSQDIGGVNPLGWLAENRNIASYKAAPFLDPSPSKIFMRPALKLRQHISAYLKNDLSLFVFDPDHAMIAYPLKIIIKLSDELNLQGADRIEMRNHYIKMLSSNNCFVPEFSQYLKSYNFNI